jgi:hypothetical protein
MHPDDGSIEDHVFEVGIRRQSLENPVEHTAFGPSAESLEDRIPVPEILGKVAPGRSNPRDPEDPFEEPPVVCRRAARIADFSRKKRRDPLPLIIAQDHTIQGHLLFGALKQILPALGSLYRP